MATSLTLIVLLNLILNSLAHSQRSHVLFLNSKLSEHMKRSIMNKKKRNKTKQTNDHIIYNVGVSYDDDFDDEMEWVELNWEETWMGRTPSRTILSNTP